MLKLKNTFLAALRAVGFTSVIYADNPGEVVAAPAEAESTEEVASEALVESSSSDTSSSSASASGDEVELSKISVTGSRIKRTDRGTSATCCYYK